MNNKPYQLSSRAQKIMLALREGFIAEPDDFNIAGRDEQLITRLQITLREFPIIYRIAFIFNLFLFDRITFLFGVGIRRFIHLKREKKVKYVQKWMCCRFFVLREMIKGFRGIIMMAYFSHKDVCRYIDYDPVQHVTERRELRTRMTLK